MALDQPLELDIRAEDPIDNGKSFEIGLTTTKIMALLNSSQFDVIYSVPYRGDEDDVMRLVHRCDSYRARISQATNINSLRRGLMILDATLIQKLPSTELRQLVTTIVNRDPSLIDGMPRLRGLLSKTFRAIDLSLIMNPTVLSAISKDVVGRNLTGDSGE